MIPNQWYAILESNEVKRGKLIGVTRMGEKLVAWRDSRGHVGVMHDLCPHRGVALSAGQILGDGVECPFHGFQFDVTGACTLIPANGRDASVPKAMHAQAFATREEHGFIFIWWGEPQDTLPPVPWFDNLDEQKYSVSSLRDHWRSHYARAIENQLDVVHLPFVHKTTIGRGNATLVNGPLYRVQQTPSGTRMDLWYDNQVDQGQKPIRSTEMPAPTRHPLIQFLFPNLWQNSLSDNMRLVIAFAPIDDANAMLYIRNYQAMVRAPIVRDIFNTLSLVGNFIIERQDRRVVITQEPKRPELRMGEKLIPGDAPIIEYRRLRDEMIEQAKVRKQP